MHSLHAPPSLLRRMAVPAAVVLLASCSALGRSSPSLKTDMEGHWAQVGQIQTAIILGDLERARQPARWLAEHEEHPALPHGVMSPVEDMRAFARSVVRAASLQDAARCVAEMAASCGRCHEASGVGPDVRVLGMPAAGHEPAEHMLRHLWAADRMWDGLVGPSDEAWRLGANALAEDPLFRDAASDEAAEAATLARETHELGIAARGTAPDHRAGVYGRLLLTCAQCHTLMGIGPERTIR